MHKVYGAFFITAALLFAGVAQADTIGQQTDHSNQVTFVSNSSGLGGQPDTFVLPPMSGTLRAFDVYLSMSSYNFYNPVTQPLPTTVTLQLGGSGCPISTGTNAPGNYYYVSDLNIPVTSSDTLPTSTLVHFALRGAENIPTYSGQSGCTIGFFQNGLTSATALATDVATGTVDQIYFVGYNNYGPIPHITRASMHSSNASSTLAKAGDAVEVDFDVDEAVQTPTVTIMGRAASVATTTGNSFEATTTLTSADTEGPVAFDVQVTSLLGDDSAPQSTTTDGTLVSADVTPPGLAITSGPLDGATTTPNVSFTFTSDDPTATLTCAFDGIATSSCAGSYSAPLAVGPHTFTLTGVDSAGNTSAISSSFSVVAPPAGSLSVVVVASGGDGAFSFSGPAPLGTFSVQTTLGMGQTDFSNIPVGTYAIAPNSLPAGWSVSDNGCASVEIDSNASAVCTIALDKGTVSGKGSAMIGLVYNDKNSNARPDRNEWSLFGSMGIKVYLDLNNNGSYDKGEPSTSTTFFGLFFFKNPAPGSYAVRIVPPRGASITAPQSGSYQATVRAGHLTFGGLFGYR